MAFVKYTQLLNSLTEEELEPHYKEKEMERLSRKISDFIQSIHATSLKVVSRNMGILIYYYHWKNEGFVKSIPYKGKTDMELPSLDFDLKNVPPVLARILSKYIDDVLQ